MFFTASALILVSYASIVNAHFRLEYPAPRGVFDAQKELTFCGGYPDAVPNRTDFPMSGGMFSIKSGHPNFVVGVTLATSQNPNTFDAFKVNGQDQIVRDFAKQTEAGTYCIPLDLSKTGNSAVAEGANITIQIVYQGGDGNLYQCADLTLRSTATVPSCTNQTDTISHSGQGSSSNGTSNGTTNGNGENGAGQNSIISLLNVAVITGLVTVFL